MNKFFYTKLLLLLILFMGCREDIVQFEDIERDGGTLFISSFPNGAQIFIKEADTKRTTPDEFPDMAPGDYEVTLKLPGFQDITVVVNMESGKNKILNVRFQPTI